MVQSFSHHVWEGLLEGGEKLKDAAQAHSVVTLVSWSFREAGKA
jgi:hypothetical protein